MTGSGQVRAQTRLVWDLPLRLFHWLLAISVLASWLSGLAGYDYRPLHMSLGYWMLGLLCFRLVWGFVGPRHARFASFFPGPRRLANYVRSLVDGSARETVGHNPLGSLMVFALLLSLGLQAISGLFLFDDIMYAGPYNEAVSSKTVDLLNGVHHTLIKVILALALFHVIAVLFYTLRKRQRLVQAMLTGRKKASIVSPSEAIAGSRIVLAIVVAVAVAVFVYWLVAPAPT